VAEVRAVPVHVAPAAQSIVAEAIDQLEAPGTVGPPEFADEPGAVGAGGVAGSSLPPAGACCPAGASPVVSEVTVAFAVERARTSGAITFASGPEEAPELVTAWHTPPDTPSQEPSDRDPRGPVDTDGSVADAELLTVPEQDPCPSHTSTAPAAEAADGPAGIRAVFTGCAVPSCGAPASASAAPGPEEAVETDFISHPPVPPVQEALPSEVRGAPPATAPSQAEVVVRTDPEHAVPASQDRLAEEVAVDDGPDSD
jgi:hypothetical protein